jgi:hypothetical protein
MADAVDRFEKQERGCPRRGPSPEFSALFFPSSHVRAHELAQAAAWDMDSAAELTLYAGIIWVMSRIENYDPDERDLRGAIPTAKLSVASSCSRLVIRFIS